MDCNCCRSVFEEAIARCPGHDVVHYRFLDEIQHAVAKGCPMCTRIVRILAHYGLQADDIVCCNRTVSFIGASEERYLIRLEFDTNMGQTFYMDLELYPARAFADTESMFPRLKSTNTGSGDSFKVAQRWLTNCLQSHQLCRSQQLLSKQLPKRLLWLAGQDTVKLVDRAAFPKGSKYATLSHCWGTKAFYKLTEATLGELQCGISSSSLPQTFAEAIQVCHQMGIEYIWIDALCIVQDNNEWNFEAVTMDQVYAGAILNIGATCSPANEHGFFRERSPELVETVLMDLTSGETSSTHIVFEPGPLFNSVIASPLLRRAWVFQERVLAVRMLHYTDTQLAWECQELKAFESLPLGHTQLGTLAWSTERSSMPGSALALDGEGEKEYWYQHLYSYRTTALTRPTDRLIAISGVAKAFKSVFPPPLGSTRTYVAGLWTSDVIQGLLWTRSGPPNHRPLGYIAPSWSWASTHDEIGRGPLAFPLRTDDRTCIADAVVEDVATVTGDEFSQVLRATLRLSAPMIELQQTATTYPPSTLGPETYGPHTYGAYVAKDVLPEEDPRGLQCAVLAVIESEFVVQWHGIILKPKPNSTEIGRFERWGSADIHVPNHFTMMDLVDRSCQNRFTDYKSFDPVSGFYTVLVD